MLKFFICFLLIGLNLACTNNVHKADHHVYPKLTQLNVQHAPEHLKIASTNQVSLAALYFKAQKKIAEKKLIIQFHGNARNITSLFDSQSWVTDHGYDFITFDYRGYGKSLGKASFPEIFDDGVAVIEYVQHNFPQHQLYLWAESLGGMALIGSLDQLQKKQNLKRVHGIIFEGAFASLKKTAQFSLQQGSLAWVSFAALLLVSDAHAPIKLLKSPLLMPFPILSIHSLTDGDVSFAEGEKLFHLLPTQHKCKLWLNDHFHVRVAKLHQGLYQQNILNFLEQGCA